MNKKKSKRRLILIRLIIILISLIGLISVASPLNGDNEASATKSYYYNIELYYNKGNISINNIEIEFSSEEKYNFNKNNSYYLEIVDNKNKILDKVFFDVPNFILVDVADEQGNFIETNESGLKELENVSFNVFASYYENGYEVVVYNKNGKELDRSFVSQFSKTGFNKEDFLGENIERDVEVGIKDRASEKRLGDEKIIGKFDVSDYKDYIIILSLILIFLIIVLIYFLKRRK